MNSSNVVGGYRKFGWFSIRIRGVVGVTEVCEPNHEDRLALVQNNATASCIVHRKLELSAEAGVNVKSGNVHEPLKLYPCPNGDEC